MTKGRLDGKIALITGSTRGIGEQIAYGFAREGAKVVVSGRTMHYGQTVVETIRKSGGIAEFIAMDLAEEDSVAQCIKRVVSIFGGLTVLVNNGAPTEHVSGVSSNSGGEFSNKTDASVTELTTEAWRKIMTPGLDGLFWTLKYAIPEMKKSGGGSIVNISTIGSIQGVGGTDAYTASKGAMNALTRSIAVNYAPDNIRCNCLLPGPVATPSLAPMLKIPAMKKAFLENILTKEIAGPEALVGPAILFSSEESSYITGQLLAVDGGLTIKMPLLKLDS